MTEWELVDKTTLKVYDWTGSEIATLDWADHKPGDSTADGWSWGGDYPDAVKEVAMWDEAVAAYTAGDIDRMARLIAEAAFEKIEKR